MSKTLDELVAPLRAELSLWADTGHHADLWLRDDDAVEATPALAQLLALAGRYGVPLTLAVIPQSTGETLAARLEGETDVHVAVHGWSHRNHAAEGAKKQELAAERPTLELCAELRAGLSKLQSLHGQRCLPMLVPPWNRIAPHLIPLLPELGFRALSTFGKAGKEPQGLALLNTHIDVMDWHGSRGGRPAGDLLSELVDALAERRLSGRHEPIGILTHHLVHDEAVWFFLDLLFSTTASHGGLAWRSASTLLQQKRSDQ